MNFEKLEEIQEPIPVETVEEPEEPEEEEAVSSNRGGCLSMVLLIMGVTAAAAALPFLV